MKSDPGAPVTLGSTAAAGARIVAWSRACCDQVEPDPAEVAAQYRARTIVRVWRERLPYSYSVGTSGFAGPAEPIIVLSRVRVARWIRR